MTRSVLNSLVRPLEARCRVDRVAHDGEFHAAGGADHADQDADAVIQADADLDRHEAVGFAFLVQFAQSPAHHQGGADGIAGVLFRPEAGRGDVAPTRP